VHYATATDSATSADFSTTSGDLTIPAGQLSRTFTVAVTGDRLAEQTESFVVNLSAPVNGGIADSQGIGTILDNEPRISINSVSKEGNGGTTQFVFTVTLAFAPGVRFMTFTINVIADKANENDETFFVNLSGASSNAFIGVGRGLEQSSTATSIRRGETLIRPGFGRVENAGNVVGADLRFTLQLRSNCGTIPRIVVVRSRTRRHAGGSRNASTEGVSLTQAESG
jgi:hypothetical protein